MHLVKSPAKLNLFLEIVSRRTDGYHNIDSIFLTVSLFDDISVEFVPEDTIEVTTDNPAIPDNEKNIIYKAVNALKKYSGVKPIILSHNLEKDYLLSMLKVGARGYISHDTSIEKLLKAIRAVYVGETWTERQMEAKILDEFVRVSKGKKPRLKDQGILSKRECEILKLLTKGIRNKEIGMKLFISEKTVKSHLSSIYRKIGVNNRIQAGNYG